MNDYFFKRHVPEHTHLKDLLITSIINTVSLDHISSTENHTTDYHISKDIEREYALLVMPVIINHMRFFEQAYEFNGIELHALWFQQYKCGGFHDWHVHPYCHFTNVYYVKLPDGNLKTQVKDPFNKNNIVEIEIQEGDILTFPSFFLHRAPVVTNNDDKIVIAFNTNIK